MRGADKTSYWIVEPKSFAYNPARINVGSIGYQSTSGNVIVSSLYEVFQTDETCNDRFLWHWFKTRLFTQQIEMLQEGGVRLYFFFDKLLKSEISMPSVDEQKLIGEQFDRLDNLITLHQCKCQYRSLCGYLSWEQRKFSDVAVIRRGLTYSPTNIVDGADGVRVLRSANINEDHFVLNDDDVFVDEGAVNIDLVHDGDILITAANGSPRLVGKRARINDLPGKTVHGGFMLVASSPCSDFLCASMGSSWYRRFLATGVAGGDGAIGNLDSKALGETTIAVPNDAEIDKLGNFFTRLDSLITFHQ